jgi:hypothetical protein
MTPDVKGWGVWIETVEITDVVISSTQLFKDMQAKFRSDRQKNAEMIQFNIDKELEE